jgi:hypothetical protein
VPQEGANNLGHANANQATSFLDSINNALDNIARATTNNKAVLKKLVATNASHTTSHNNLAAYRTLARYARCPPPWGPKRHANNIIPKQPTGTLLPIPTRDGGVAQV